MVDSTNKLTVALIQQHYSNNIEDNTKKTIQAIADAASQGAQLIILSELHQSQYFCQTEDTANFALAETIPGPTSDKLCQLAKNHNVVIVGSIFEKRTSGLYHNTAIVADRDGRLCGKYRKMHIPDDPSYYEKFYFTPGDLGFNPIETSLGKLGILICWDQWFPEAARLMAMKGAQLLIYPTAIGWDRADQQSEQERQHQAWMLSQQAHAIANGVTVLSCNRVGFEPAPGASSSSSHSSQPSDQGIQFWGSSFIAGPQGEILALAPNCEAEVLVHTINLNRTEQVRNIWPFLRDRRIDAYEGLTERYLEN